MKSDSHGRGESTFLSTMKAECYGKALEAQKYLDLHESAPVSKLFGILRGEKIEGQSV